MTRMIFIAVLFGFLSVLPVRTAQAACPCTPCACCCQERTSCSNTCKCTDEKQQKVTVQHITDEFIKHREWLITVLWNGHVLPSMMLMTEQLSAVAMQQMLVMGTIFDAKHQLETQRIFQNLHAQAHKDYSVSEGMCEFGTGMKSLAASDRNMEFSQSVIASRGLQRQLMSGDNIAGKGMDFDAQARLEQFKAVYCNPKDNGDLSAMCDQGGIKERYNKDIDFVHTLDTRETLTVDFTPDGDKDHKDRGVTEDEEDIFALSANLYGNALAPLVPPIFLQPPSPSGSTQLADNYFEIRALAAKRAVAQNSFAAIAAMKAQGPKQENGDKSEVQPYLEAILLEMGIPQEDITKMLGDRPSYYAQMEVLTRKLYQEPVFYAQLYDKPANVARKDVAMRAIGSIQKRDMFKSMLRSEAIMSVWLETELLDEADRIKNEKGRLNQNADLIDLGD